MKTATVKKTAKATVKKAVSKKKAPVKKTPAKKTNSCSLKILSVEKADGVKCHIEISGDKGLLAQSIARAMASDSGFDQIIASACFYRLELVKEKENKVAKPKARKK